MLPVLKVLSAHGLNGAVRFFLLNPIKQDERLLSSEGGTFTIKSINEQKNLIKFSEINDRTAAEKLKGKILYQRKTALGDNEYYASDMIGQKLLVAEDSSECVITGTHNFGAGDILEVSYKGKTILLPFRKEFISEEGTVSINTIVSFL